MPARATLAMFAAMLRVGRVSALTALCLAVGACGRSAQDGAAKDVEAFLTAVQAHDGAGFEAVVDRPAVRHDLRRQIVQIGRTEGLDVDGGPSEMALDQMIGVDKFHLVQAGGAPLAQPPSLGQVKAMVKPLDHDHACVHDLTPRQDCLLIFARETPAKGVQGQARWRLVRMPAQDVALAVPPAAEKR